MRRNILEKSKFDTYDGHLLSNLVAGQKNWEGQSSNFKPLVRISWDGIVELEILINLISSTNAHKAWTGKLAVFRIVQGIRTDLIEALLAVEKGFYASSGPILRSAVENAAVAIAVTQSDKLFDELEAGTLSTTRCISTARKVFEEVGKRYGLLTELGVHQNFTSLGFNLDPTSGKHELMKTPIHNIHTETANLPITASILHIAFMSYFTLELAFKTDLPKLRQIIDHGETVSTNNSGPITTLIDAHNDLTSKLVPLIKEYELRFKSSNL